MQEEPISFSNKVATCVKTLPHPFYFSVLYSKSDSKANKGRIRAAGETIG